MRVKGVWGEEIEVADAIPQNETPKEDTPAPSADAEPKQTEQPNQEQPDPFAHIKEISGGLIDNEDKLKNILEIVTKYPELEKNYTELQGKIPQFKDDNARTFFEKLASGDEDEVFAYLSEKKRDYDTMSDIDAIRWGLKKANPEWRDKDIDAEIRFKYGKDFSPRDTTDLDGEELEVAQKHNEQLESRLLLLERDARDARINLNKQKINIELPKIQQQAAPQDNQPTPEQIAKQREDWKSYVKDEMPKVGDLKWEVEGEEVSYKLTDTDRKALQSDYEEYDAAKKFTELGWRDGEGKLFPAKMAKDEYIIRNIDQIVKAAFSQGVTAGQKKTTADIKNINLTNNSNPVDAAVVLDAWQQSKEKLYKN